MSPSGFLCTFPCKGKKEKKESRALHFLPAPSFCLHRSHASFVTGFWFCLNINIYGTFIALLCVSMPLMQVPLTHCDSPHTNWLAPKSAEYFLANKFSHFSKWPSFPLSFNSHFRKRRAKRKLRLLKQKQCELIVKQTNKKSSCLLTCFVVVVGFLKLIFCSYEWKRECMKEKQLRKTFACAKRVVICAILTKIHQCLNASCVLENLPQKSLFVKFEPLTWLYGHHKSPVGGDLRWENLTFPLTLAEQAGAAV